MNYGWPVNIEREREGSVLGRPLPPPGLWKCHAVSVAMQMVTPECCEREERGGKKERKKEKPARKRDLEELVLIF